MIEEVSEITGRIVKSGRTEAEYRALEVDSSSSVKIFADDRHKYWKKFVKGDYVEEDDSVAITIGKLVDCYRLDEEEFEKEFDQTFFRSRVAQAPTGMMGQFVESLYTRTMQALDKATGEVTRDMNDIMLEAYNDVKFDRDGNIVAFKRQTYEKTVEIFSNTDAVTYYNEIRQIRPKGLTVITSSLEEQAMRVNTQLRTSENTKHLFNPYPEIQIFNQLKIDGFEIDGLPLKGMIDRTEVDHKLKTIQIDDFKCTWNVEDFVEKYYLYRKSYLQALIYFKAVFGLHADLGFDYSGYTVLPTRFIVADSSAFYEPLIYVLEMSDLDDAYGGFTHKGRKYIGLSDIIEDLKFARDNNIWNISRNNYNSGGVVFLNSKIEK